MTVAVGVVILGGIKSIAKTAEKIVPLMCTIYVLACLYILITNAGLVPAAFVKSFPAHSFEAGLGGFIGILVVGFKRAAFSSKVTSAPQPLHTPPRRPNIRFGKASWHCLNPSSTPLWFAP